MMTTRRKRLAADRLRQLAAAVVLQAVLDACAGDEKAAAWLEEDGFEIARRLGVSEGRIQRWREAEIRVPVGGTG